MVENVQPFGADEYREKAVKLRLLAHRSQHPDSCARLLALAESFERLAAQVEIWARTM